LGTSSEERVGCEVGPPVDSPSTHLRLTSSHLALTRAQGECR